MQSHAKCQSVLMTYTHESIIIICDLFTLLKQDQSPAEISHLEHDKFK